MKKVLFLPVIALIIFLTACEAPIRGKGDLITETRDHQDFHALDISTQGRVEVRRDSVFSIEITCEENLMPYLETKIENGTLQIDFDRPVWDADGLLIRVSAPNWDGFELSGSANVKILDAISGTQLTAKISGSGDLNFADLDFLNVEVDISGSGKVTLKGIGNYLEADINGSGDVEALDFFVKNAKAEISGSGNIRLQVSDYLDAEISGSGDIEYLGNPQLSVDVSGSGKVRKI
jgi:hypothetical protein